MKVKEDFLIVWAWSMNVALLVLGGSAFADVEIALDEVVTDLSLPVYITHAGDGTGRLFIVEQAGTIRILENGSLLETPFLDTSSRVSLGGSQGLLSVAFHPNFAVNGRFFVNYTDTDGDTMVSEFSVSDGDPNVAEDTSEKIILQVDQPRAVHNGGQLQFGPDGMLYIGMGDGGGSGDVFGNGQNTATLLGALLRIDVDNGSPFSIPADNPFVGQLGRDEIWAYGLRNPWRFSFDRQTGQLFLGDVGNLDVEEIDIIVPGGNYGWNIMEGYQCFPPGTDCDMTGLIPPITAYGHPPSDLQGGYAVMGGYVYRGSRFPDLNGLYFFGDYSLGRIWILEETNPGVFERQELLDMDFLIVSFGEDEAGELYVVDHAGSIYQIVSLGGAENNAPVLDPIGLQRVTEGELLEFTVTATDPNRHNLTFSASNLPSGAMFDSETSVFSWATQLGDAGNYVGTQFRVTDDGEPPMADSETILIVVQEAAAESAEGGEGESSEGDGEAEDGEGEPEVPQEGEVEGESAEGGENAGEGEGVPKR